MTRKNDIAQRETEMPKKDPKYGSQQPTSIPEKNGSRQGLDGGTNNPVATLLTALSNRVYESLAEIPQMDKRVWEELQRRQAMMELHNGQMRWELSEVMDIVKLQGVEKQLNAIGIKYDQKIKLIERGHHMPDKLLTKLDLISKELEKALETRNYEGVDAMLQDRLRDMLKGLL